MRDGVIAVCGICGLASWALSFVAMMMLFYSVKELQIV